MADGLTLMRSSTREAVARRPHAGRNGWLRRELADTLFPFVRLRDLSYRNSVPEKVYAPFMAKSSTEEAP